MVRRAYLYLHPIVNPIQPGNTRACSYSVLRQVNSIRPMIHGSLSSSLAFLFLATDHSSGPGLEEDGLRVDWSVLPSVAFRPPGCFWSFAPPS